MKKVLGIMLGVCLIFAAFSAIAEDAPVKVGQSADDGIYRYTATNGQDIYFLAREPGPNVRYIDVNFDGIDDLVISTVMGASNFFYEFFVWDGSQYALTEHYGSEYGLCNYELYPENKLVLSAQSNGYAGALYERYLYTWEGAQLKLIRSAVSTEYVTAEWSGSTYTTTTDNDKLRIIIRDFTKDIYEGEILLDEVITLDAMTEEAFSRYNDRLFDGLR